MSDIGDKADVQTSHRERLQIADTVEKLFQGVRADRLIRQQTVWSNNDSNAAPSRFYYCGNVILEQPEAAIGNWHKPTSRQPNTGVA
jgi:hypothetical protein